MAHYILLDTETTGGEEKDRIIQLGFLELASDGAIAVYDDLCLAEVPISYGAMEVHGITPDRIEGKPACTQTNAYQRLETLNTPENILIIHNAPFDMGMLEKEGFSSQMRLIDTLRCARHLFPEEEAHRLQYFRYRLGLYKDEKAEADKLGIEVKAHDAIGDVLILKLLLTELRKAVQEQFPEVNAVEKLIALTTQPVYITRPMRFGKHKGKTIQDLATEDPGYLRWMLDNMESLDEDTRYTINRVLGS